MKPALVIEILDKGVPFPDGQIVAAVSASKVEIGLAGLHEIANKLPSSAPERCRSP